MPVACPYAFGFLRDGFTANMVRGKDSAGIAAIDLDQLDYMVHKLPLPGMYFAEDAVAEDLMKDACAKNSLAMTHVRAATQGSINLRNAHPFEIVREEFSMVGVHNGTLSQWRYKTDGNKYEVDSEWALNRIADKGLDAFKEFSGSYAFVWWRGDNPDTLYMARNKERPMAVAFLKNGGMAYGSEAGMLYWLLERNKIEVKQIMLLEEGKLYEFDVAKPENYTTTDLPAGPAAWTTTPGSYSTTRTYTTTVERVDTLIKEAIQNTAANEERDFPMAFEQEVKLAKEYGWHDIEADFSPMYVDNNGDTVGIAEVLGTEMDAVVRGNYKGQFSMETVWRCWVLGLQDAANNLTLVLDKPRKEISLMDLADTLQEE